MGIRLNTEADYQALLAKQRGEAAPVSVAKKPGRIPHERCTADGFTFDSKVERERYYELVLLMKAKVITDLKVHEKFTFVRQDVKIGSYTSDFSYCEFQLQYDEKRLVQKLVYVVEDVKSAHTVKDRHYRRQKKLMLAFHGITIHEIVR